MSLHIFERGINGFWENRASMHDSLIWLIALGMFMVPISTLSGSSEVNNDSESPQQRMQPLKSHAWSDRPLLLFGPTPDDPEIKKQIEMLEASQAGITDRDMAIYKVFKESGIGPEGSLKKGKIAALRHRFDVEVDEKVLILVGKDTTEKMREKPPVSMETIFERIDQMPMRKREMKE